jgi:hypothetical protein
MSTTAVPSLFPAFLSTEPFARSSAEELERNPISPLLDVAMVQANAQGAYVWRFDRANSAAELAAFAGPNLQQAIRRIVGKLPAMHWQRTTTVVLPSQAASDWRFADFPEFRSGKFDGVVSVPLLHAGEAVGVANFCRRGEAGLSASALSLLMSLSLPLGSLLISSSLSDRLVQATQELADRKMVERAKGLVQARFQWSEEETYLRLRRLSRASRTPLRDIARLILEAGVESVEEALEQDA